MNYTKEQMKEFENNIRIDEREKTEKRMNEKFKKEFYTVMVQKLLGLFIITFSDALYRFFMYDNKCSNTVHIIATVFIVINVFIGLFLIFTRENIIKY